MKNLFFLLFMIAFAGKLTTAYPARSILLDNAPSCPCGLDEDEECNPCPQK